MITMYDAGDSDALDQDGEDYDAEYDRLSDLIDKTRDDLTQAMRSFNQWVYDQLQQECDYLTGDEYIGDLVDQLAD